MIKFDPVWFYFFYGVSLHELRFLLNKQCILIPHWTWKESTFNDDSSCQARHQAEKSIYALALLWTLEAFLKASKVRAKELLHSGLLRVKEHQPYL